MVLGGVVFLMKENKIVIKEIIGFGEKKYLREIIILVKNVKKEVVI